MSLGIWCLTTKAVIAEVVDIMVGVKVGLWRSTQSTQRNLLAFTNDSEIGRFQNSKWTMYIKVIRYVKWIFKYWMFHKLNAIHHKSI